MSGLFPNLTVDIEPVHSLGTAGTACPYAFAIDENTLGYATPRYIVLCCLPIQEERYISLPTTIQRVHAAYVSPSGEYLCLVATSDTGKIQLSIYYFAVLQCLTTIVLSESTKALATRRDVIQPDQIPRFVEFSEDSKSVVVHYGKPVSTVITINWQHGQAEDIISIPDDTLCSSVCPHSIASMLSGHADGRIRIWRSIDGEFKSFAPTKMMADIVPTVEDEMGVRRPVRIFRCLWFSAGVSCVLTSPGDILVFSGPAFIGCIPARYTPQLCFFETFGDKEPMTLKGDLSATYVFDNYLFLGTTLGELVCLEVMTDFEDFATRTRSKTSSLSATAMPAGGDSGGVVAGRDGHNAHRTLFSLAVESTAADDGEVQEMDIFEMAMTLDKVECRALGLGAVPRYPHTVRCKTLIQGKGIRAFSCCNKEYVVVETTDAAVYVWPLNFDTTLYLDPKKMVIRMSGRGEDDCEEAEDVKIPAEVRPLVGSLSSLVASTQMTLSQSAIDKFAEIVDSHLDAEVVELAQMRDTTGGDTASETYVSCLKNIAGIFKERAVFDVETDPDGRVCGSIVAGADGLNLGQVGALLDVSNSESMAGTPGSTPMMAHTALRPASVAAGIERLALSTPASAVPDVPNRHYNTSVSGCLLNCLTPVSLWSDLITGFPICNLQPCPLRQLHFGPRGSLSEVSVLRPGTRVGASSSVNTSLAGGSHITAFDASDITDTFVFGTSEGEIYVGNASTGKVFAKCTIGSEARGISIGPTGLYCLVHYNEGIGLFNINDSALTSTAFLSEVGLVRFRQSNNGGYIALHVNCGGSNVFIIRRSSDFSEVGRFTGHLAKVVHMQFVPGDSALVTVSADGMIFAHNTVTFERVFDVVIKNATITSALVVTGNQIPADIFNFAAVSTALRSATSRRPYSSTTTGMPGARATIAAQRSPGSDAGAISRNQGEEAHTDQDELANSLRPDEVPGETLIRPSGVIDSDTYEPFVVLCFDDKGTAYEAISGHVTSQVSTGEPLRITGLCLVPQPVTLDMLRDPAYLDKLLRLNQRDDEANAPSELFTVTAAAFGGRSEDRINRSRDNPSHSKGAVLPAEQYDRETRYTRIGDRALRSRDLLQEDSGQDDPQANAQGEFQVRQDASSPDDTCPRDALFSQRPVALSESPACFLFAFTDDGWLTVLGWPLRDARVVYRKRLSATSFVGARLLRGSMLVAASSDALIISNIRFLVPSRDVFSPAVKNVATRKFCALFTENQQKQSVFLRLPLSCTRPSIPYEHVSRTVEQGAETDRLLFHLVTNAADMWTSTDYRAAILKEAARERGKEISARIGIVREAAGREQAAVEALLAATSQENDSLEREFSDIHSRILALAKEQFGDTIARLKADVQGTREQLAAQRERHSAAIEGAAAKRSRLLQQEAFRRNGLHADLQAQTERQDEALALLESAVDEELRQTEQERVEALRVVNETSSASIQREQAVAAALKGWESMQSRRISTLSVQTSQIERETYLERLKMKDVTAEIARTKAEIDAGRRTLEQHSATIIKQERRLFELKAEAQAVGKRQFVFEHQITDLKAEIQPRNELISNMQTRVAEVSGQLERMQIQWEQACRVHAQEHRDVRSLTGEVSVLGNRIGSRRRMLDAITKDVIRVVTENNTDRWPEGIRGVWDKYSAVLAEVNAATVSSNKNLIAQEAVREEVLENKSYLSGRISDLYEQLGLEVRKYNTVQAFALDENSALLTESHRLRDENISLRVQLHRVNAMLEELKVKELNEKFYSSMAPQTPDQDAHGRPKTLFDLVREDVPAAGSRGGTVSVSALSTLQSEQRRIGAFMAQSENSMQ